MKKQTVGTKGIRNRQKAVLLFIESNQGTLSEIAEQVLGEKTSASIKYAWTITNRLRLRGLIRKAVRTTGRVCYKPTKLGQEACKKIRGEYGDD